MSDPVVVAYIAGAVTGLICGAILGVVFALRR